MNKFVDKVKKGLYKGADTTTPLNKGEEAHVAFVGYAHAGLTKSKFGAGDNFVDSGLTFWEYVDTRLKGKRFVIQINTKPGPTSKKNKLLNAMEAATGNPFKLDIESIGTVVRVKTQEGNPMYKEQNWHILPPKAGMGEKIEMSDEFEPLWFPKTSDGMPKEMYINMYKTIIGIDSWVKSLFESSPSWPTSEIAKLLASSSTNSGG